MQQDKAEPSGAARAPFWRDRLSGRQAVLFLWFWTLFGVASFGVAFVNMYMPTHGGYDVMGKPIGHDFMNVWLPAKLALEGRVREVFSIDSYNAALRALLHKKKYIEHAFSYPPHLLVLVLPFGLLPYFASLAAWTAGGVAAFFGAVRGMVKPHAGWPVLALLALSPVAVVNYCIGHNGLYTAALFLGGLGLSESAPVVAGVMIGMLTIKPQLGILLPFALLARRNWKCMGATALTALALAGASILLWGVYPWEQFLHETIPYQKAFALGRQPGTYYWMMPGIFTNAFPLAKSTLWSRLGWGLLQAVCAGFAAYASLRAVKEEGMTPAAILMLALATLVVSPYSFNYDMAAVAGAIVIYLSTRDGITVGEHAFFGLVWMLPMAIYTAKYACPPVPAAIIVAALARLSLNRRRGSSATR